MIFLRLDYFFRQLFFPTNATCVNCLNEEVFKYGLCRDCYKALSPLSENQCEICRDAINTEGLCASCMKEKPDYTRLYCLFSYKPPLDKLIKDFKRNNKRYLKYDFAKIALDSIEEVADKITLITAVPISKNRLRERGYNQAELLGKELSYLTDIPYKNVLVRAGSTRSSLLNKDERIKQLKGQFDFDKSVFGETVLLIDDICTTGTTLRHCAKLLKKAGAKEVYCCVIARTERKF